MKKTLLILALFTTFLQSKAAYVTIVGASFAPTDTVAPGSTLWVDVKAFPNAASFTSQFYAQYDDIHNHGSSSNNTYLKFLPKPNPADTNIRRITFTLGSTMIDRFLVRLVVSGTGYSTITGFIGTKHTPTTVTGTVTSTPGTNTLTGTNTVTGTSTVAGTNTITGTHTVSGTSSVTGISDDVIEDVPVLVQYYDLNGNSIAFTYGIAIKVEFFRNGSVRKSKVCIVNP